MKKILFVGPQGSGKSTQAKLLAESLPVPVISTGDIFRQIAHQKSELAKKVRQILDEGKLVDDQTTAELVKERLNHPDCQRGFILDGYPRRMEQIALFDPGFDMVLYLKLSDEEATLRLSGRGREDDTSKLIAERLKIYHQQTDPILEYYLKKGLLKTIDGVGTIEQIQQRIREAVHG